MNSRRTFLKYTGATTLTLFAYSKLGGLRQAIAQIPGGTLDPGPVSKFVTPLLIPPVMPKAGTIKLKGGKNADYYEISMKQFAQQILPAGLLTTTVWGYGAVTAPGKKALLIHNAPSLTIEARWRAPVVVKWINDLKDANGDFQSHLLPVDPTLHWANPPGGTTGRDTRPSFVGFPTPGPYAGPVPIVTHVHGAIGVGDESDGYAEAWYLPNAMNIPAGYATVGTWRDFFADKANQKFGVTWGLGFAVFQYPNDQRASTIWYHDHALGMTRLNVYAGPAGFYIIRGGPAGDGAVLDSATGLPAVLPGPAPHENDKFPPNKTYYEVPIAIQDRSFNNNGSLFYPDSRAFFGDVSPQGPITSFIPTSDVSPIANPEFFGNMIMVNGNTWPFLTVERRRYRLRLLNGCDSRMLVLKFDHPNVAVWQIGNEAGFLVAPVNVNATPPDPSVADGGKAVLLMGNAERADLIVDFTGVPAGTTSVKLRNVGPDAPFGGFPIPAEDAADPATTGQVIEFRVINAMSPDLTTPPDRLVLPPIPALPATTMTRKLVLAETHLQPRGGTCPSKHVSAPSRPTATIRR